MRPRANVRANQRVAKPSEMMRPMVMAAEVLPVKARLVPSLGGLPEIYSPQWVQREAPERTA